MPTNLELKARCPNPYRVIRILSRKGIQKRSLLVQTDTYFRSEHGRFKLREIRGSASELIWYRRPDRRKNRYSSYLRIPIVDGNRVKRALASECGILTVVKKKRKLFQFKNARIHLDAVQGLGSFIEFEVLVTRGRKQARQLLNQLMHMVEIRSRSIVVFSYSDLMARSIRKKQ